jgi:hypothetical protein
MQERLTGGPFVALGVPPSATASEIRTAFLQLTKTYHPARFGYMSPELQRLSNEVFLALRAAHDAIAKPTRGTAKSVDRSGITPATPIPTGPRPVVAAAPASTRPGAVAPGGLSPSRPAGASSPPALATSSSLSATPPGGVRVGVMRPIGAVARPGTPRPGSAGTGAPPAAAAPAAAPSQAPATTTPAAAATAGKADELAPILEQMRLGQWDAARAALAALAARSPEVPRYRALICYARGREAQLSYDLDAARVELQDALQIDPELQLAKTALAELFTRRK